MFRSVFSAATLSKLVWICRHFLQRKSQLLVLTLCALLVAGCCDLRWTIDTQQDPNAYTPAVKGAPTRFVLEIYARSNFDLSHSDIGQTHISMSHRDLKPVGPNFARSVILHAPIGTALEITAENGQKGLGRVVGPERRLRIADVCIDNDKAPAPTDGSYTTDGHLSCRLKGMVVRGPTARR